jgi:hypothetical protein
VAATAGMSGSTYTRRKASTAGRAGRAPGSPSRGAGAGLAVGNGIQSRAWRKAGAGGAGRAAGTGAAQRDAPGPLPDPLLELFVAGAVADVGLITCGAAETAPLRRHEAETRASAAPCAAQRGVAATDVRLDRADALVIRLAADFDALVGVALGLAAPGAARLMVLAAGAVGLAALGAGTIGAR